jgi:hypothetical protein
LLYRILSYRLGFFDSGKETRPGRGAPAVSNDTIEHDDDCRDQHAGPGTVRIFDEELARNSERIPCSLLQSNLQLRNTKFFNIEAKLIRVNNYEQRG